MTCETSTLKAWTGNRPRFLRFTLLMTILPMLLSGCGWYGNGLSALPANEGWFPLPIHRWLVNAGVETTAMVICPPDRCASPGVAILFEADPATARQLEASLNDDRALTARKPRPILHRIGERARAASPKIKAISRVERFTDQGNPVLRIAMVPQSGNGKAAFAVVISIKQAQGRRYALAIATNAEQALSQARAIAASSVTDG
jgi:hypothetical protein